MLKKMATNVFLTEPYEDYSNATISLTIATHHLLTNVIKILFAVKYQMKIATARKTVKRLNSRG